jgi:ankyrin repeat protein
MRILVGPSDYETDQAFNELTPNDALFWSIKGNLLRYVKKAIKNGADKNGNFKSSPLVEACYYNYIDIIKYLIEIGANINYITNDCWSPLHAASYKNNIDCVKLLINSGAKINIKDYVNATPLDYAMDTKNFDIIKLLIEHGADINMKKCHLPQVKKFILKITESQPTDNFNQNIYFNQK